MGNFAPKNIIMAKRDAYTKLCLDNNSERVVEGKEGNIIPPPEKEPLWKGFLEKFKDPLIIVLLVVFFFSIVVSTYEVFYQGASYSSYIEPCGVLVALLLATGVGFCFEVKAAKEFEVLELLVKNPNKIYSRDVLLQLIWSKDCPEDARTVDVHIRRLREKIEENPSNPAYVHTKWGLGYYYSGQ